MKCYYHSERDAVANCCICGKALCKECGGLYSRPYCDACAKEEVNKRKMDLLKLSAIGAAFSLLLLVTGISDGFELTLTNILDVAWGTIMALFMPFGWRALNRLTPNVFLALPIVGWIVYFVIKIFISCMIGWLAAPVLIYKAIQLKKTVEQVEGTRLSEMC